MSDKWLIWWGSIIRELSDAIDLLETEHRTLERQWAIDTGRHRRWQNEDALSWSSYYERPVQQNLIVGMYSFFTPKQAMSLLVRVARALSKPNGWAKRESAREEPPPAALKTGKILSMLHALSAQGRALLICGKSMSQLVTDVRSGDDESLFMAIRIDPVAIFAPTIQRRFHAAVATADHAFVTKVSTALRQPARELQYSRLQSALLLLALGGHIHMLNEKTAADLFIHRTRLYPSMGRADAHRSLWRFVQRWKKDHATLIRGKMSSSMLRL